MAADPSQVDGMQPLLLTQLKVIRPDSQATCRIFTRLELLAPARKSLCFHSRLLTPFLGGGVWLAAQLVSLFHSSCC